MTTTVSAAATTPLTTQPWRREECTQQKVSALIIRLFKELIAESQIRSEAKELAVLDRGFWYPQHYANSLQQKNQQKRFTYLKDKGSFFYGLPPKGFTHKQHEKSGEKQIFLRLVYILAKGVAATEGLDNIKRGTFCFTDCGQVLQIAYYEALLQIWGESIFNRYFDAEGKTAMQFNPDIGKTPLGYFLDSKNSSEMEEGDRIYFYNMTLYPVKHSLGENLGFNTLCIKKDSPSTFIAFGLPAEGVTEDQILEKLAAGFNEDPPEKGKLLPPELSEIFEKTLGERCAMYAESVNNPSLASLALAVVLHSKITKEDLKDAHKSSPKEVGLHPTAWQFSAKYIAIMLN